MSTSGTVTQNPAAKPGGSSSGAQGVRSPSAGTGSRLANCPRRMVTPVPATSASAVNSTIEARSRRPAGSSAAAIGGPIIAEATADVVCAGARRVRTSTRCPRSARHTAVLNPITPAPITTTSGRVAVSPTHRRAAGALRLG